ncbi:restriction endonuclease subunit S [Methylicorpusculum sp.]|uniref:restriction endonuclease subunit S n=1 Tax=Methylicorpusculum sp. TaxID=2713644 RepID=UPI00272511CE|nr:restriction endonuclease subunit S [Methylicorpusculum sp.]MDO8844741.1 restriction endonuclease subunit S [Methylicorpusculum sp.]
MSNIVWPKKPLSILTSKIGDGIHGTPIYVETGGFPFVNGNNLKQGAIVITEDTKRVDQEEFEKYFIEFDENTLFMSINGTLGSLAKYNGEEIILGKSAAYIKCKGINIDYLYYYLQLKEVKNQMWNIATGSTIKNLSLASIRELEVPVPSGDIQTKIAQVFSVIDAKIELNNRINAELEAMAKTLYDYWFVQFDFPFDFAQGKPATNGKPYKSSGGKMAYNPILKREIPEEWETTTVGKIAKTALGGTPSTEVDDYWENADIPWLSSAETASFPVVGSEQKITQKGLEDSAATLLPKGTVVISIVRYIRPSILGIDAATNQSVVGIKECSRLKSSFIYPYFCSEVPRLMGLRTGAQQPHINKRVIDESPIVLPTDCVLEEYYKKLDPIYEQIMTLAFENYKLIELREWLLPMLMNGQVTIKQ